MLLELLIIHFSNELLDCVYAHLRVLVNKVEQFGVSIHISHTPSSASLSREKPTHAAIGYPSRERCGVPWWMWEGRGRFARDPVALGQFRQDAALGTCRVAGKTKTDSCEATIGLFTIDVCNVTGGESEIRTHGAELLLTRFRGGRLKPLSHLSAKCFDAVQRRTDAGAGCFPPLERRK